jgi:hypothetical protein
MLAIALMGSVWHGGGPVSSSSLSMDGKVSSDEVLLAADRAAGGPHRIPRPTASPEELSGEVNAQDNTQQEGLVADDGGDEVPGLEETMVATGPDEGPEEVEGETGPREEEEDRDDSGVVQSVEEEEETAKELDRLAAAHAAEHSSAPVSMAPAAPVLNIRPHPRLPPRDPTVAAQMRYISYENHSGFHNRETASSVSRSRSHPLRKLTLWNFCISSWRLGHCAERKSLINALLIAKILNRTLLLPPARLGYAAPWEPHLDKVIPFDERCKAGTPLPTDEPCGTTADRWTYVGWSYLLDDDLFQDRAIVDRWNGSIQWMYESVARGGLGLVPDEVERFQDKDRRSYQLYDDRATKTNLQMFSSRIDLEDLDQGPIRDKRLLHFGSLFSGGRLNLKRQENVDEAVKINNAIVFEIDKVDDISDEIRDALGDYVAVHLRVGDGAFKVGSSRESRNSHFYGCELTESGCRIPHTE